jgi:hypothetical protein
MEKNLDQIMMAGGNLPVSLDFTTPHNKIQSF